MSHRLRLCLLFCFFFLQNSFVVAMDPDSDAVPSNIVSAVTESDFERLKRIEALEEEGAYQVLDNNYTHPFFPSTASYTVEDFYSKYPNLPIRDKDINVVFDNLINAISVTDVDYLGGLLQKDFYWKHINRSEFYMSKIQEMYQAYQAAPKAQRDKIFITMILLLKKLAELGVMFSSHYYRPFNSILLEICRAREPFWYDYLRPLTLDKMIALPPRGAVRLPSLPPRTNMQKLNDMAEDVLDKRWLW